MAGAASRDWIVVYDLRADEEQLEQMQKVSLDDESDGGLAPDPLVGGPEWWDEIEMGRRRTFRIEGTIERVYFGSMGDWPLFSIRALDGSVSEWTREGDARRYVEGLCVRLCYVEHAGSLVRTSQIVGSVEVENSPRRSAGVAPGPHGSATSCRDPTVRCVTT
jgi:hypothetical protein